MSSPEREPRRARAAALLLAILALIAGVFVKFTGERGQRDTAAREVERASVRASARGPLASSKPASFALSGTVRDRSGAPITAALVCAACASCEESAMPKAACVLTGATGGYVLRDDRFNAVLITASAAGYASGQANGGLPVVTGPEPHSGLDITLERGGARVAGVVIDALGGPVVEARVQLSRFAASAWSRLEATTDGDGRFELWTAPGQIALRAEAPGYAPAQRGYIAPSETVELRMTPASTVRGRVVEAGSERPVAGLEVRAVPTRAAAPSAPAISDHAGEFVLSALDPGVYMLVAVGDRWRGQSAQPIEVGLAEVIERVTVRVTPAVSVSGLVTLAGSEQGCRRGLVLLERFSEPSALVSGAPSQSVLTAPIEADGSVRVPGISAGRYHVTVQCLEHVLRDGPREIEIQDRDLDLRWRVERGIGLTVHTRDERGAPVPHAPMLLVMPPERAGLGPSGTPIVSDAQGEAVVPSDLSPGTYSVEPDRGLQGQPVTIELRAGMVQAEVTLRLQGSGTIALEAVDAQGRGISGLQLNARPLQPEVAAAMHSVGVLASAPAASLGTLAVELGGGRYRIGPVASGSYAVEVNDGINPPRRAEAGGSTAIEVRSGEVSELRLLLERGGVLRGRVVDDRGEPEANVWVTANANDERAPAAWMARMRSGPAAVMTNIDGAFAIDGLEPQARYTVQAKVPHGSAAALHDVAVGSDVQIVLPAPATIRGQIADAQGESVAGAVVRARHADTRTTRSGVVQPDGTFLIDQVPPGRVTLSTISGGSELVQAEQLDLQPGQAMAGVRLSLAPAPLLEAQPPAEQAAP